MRSSRPTLSTQERKRRHFDIISGMIAIVVVTSLIVVGVAWSFGFFDDSYEIKASFDAAGQGLIKGSDVKMRGMNVGKVQSVKLVDGRAEVVMAIRRSQKVPQAIDAVVRPKTLFGEKYVDLYVGPEGMTSEADGPFFEPDGSAAIPKDRSKGGFELEQVLRDTYPLLQAIKPADLKVIISSLADASEGMGPVVNRQLVNGQKVLDVLARHNADTAQFLTDLAKLATELGVRSDDLVAAAVSLNNTLPTLNSQSDNLNTLLVQTARLSEDAADIVDNNKAFIDKSFNEGQLVLDTLYGRQEKIVPLIVGLRQYLTVLSAPGRMPSPKGDGTLAAAVKMVNGEAHLTEAVEELCKSIPIVCDLLDTVSVPAADAALADQGLLPALPQLPTATGTTSTAPLSRPTSGVQAILDLVGGLLGGQR